MICSCCRGIQHYMFCPRQWALIHIDQQWQENKLTVEGDLLHNNVDNPFYRQKMVRQLLCAQFLLLPRN